MTNFMKITEFNIKINKDTAFRLIDLYPGNSIYDDVMAVYDELENKVMDALHPRAYIKLEKPTPKLGVFLKEGYQCRNEFPVVYVLVTLGDKINALSDAYLREGNYLLGLLVNAMSDAYLFQLDNFLRDMIVKFCDDKMYGIARRLHAPEDLPMSFQKDILDEIKKEEELSINVTDGFMFTTIKTMGYVILLTSREQGTSKWGHHCRSCMAKNCKLRSTKESM